MSIGCPSRNDPTTAPMSSSPASSASPPTTGPGELTTKEKVTFEAQSKGGPGTMGPTVLSPKSDAALEEVRAHLAAHPEATPLRIECAVNPMTMSSTPNTRWPAGLALKVARWLVDHGIDCKRLEVVGWLDNEPNAPAERVRFFIGGKSDRPPDRETRLDACSK
jgi:hypothetical protein